MSQAHVRGSVVGSKTSVASPVHGVGVLWFVVLWFVEGFVGRLCLSVTRRSLLPHQAEDPMLSRRDADPFHRAVRGARRCGAPPVPRAAAPARVVPGKRPDCAQWNHSCPCLGRGRWRRMCAEERKKLVEVAQRSSFACTSPRTAHVRRWSPARGGGGIKR